MYHSECIYKALLIKYSVLLAIYWRIYEKEKPDQFDKVSNIVNKKLTWMVINLIV